MTSNPEELKKSPDVGPQFYLSGTGSLLDLNEAAIGPEDVPYLLGSYHEAYDMEGERQAESLQALAELVGDIAVSEQLRREAWTDIQKGEEMAEDFKIKRANEGAKRMEAHNYAAEATTFEQQLLDKGRVAPFYYNDLPSHLSNRENWPIKEQAEVAGLHQLDDFLKLVASMTKPDGTPVFPEDTEQAVSIMENLSFIGKREFDEAVRGIGEYWKQYLDQDANNKLVILRGISDSEKYPGRTKSDSYLIDKVLDTFSDEELLRYQNRMPDNIAAVRSLDPKNVRIVLADDWTISGQQLSRAYQDIVKDPDNSKFRDNIEINLIVSSAGRIAEGLRSADTHPSVDSVKVKAYYKAHNAPKAKFGAHVSGTHSTANIDFGDVIERMHKHLQKLGFAQDELPTLATVVSPYKMEQKS